MRKLLIAVLAAGVAMMLALTGCGGGGGGTKGGNPPPPATGSTIIQGTIKDTHSPARLMENVVVKLGALQTTTDASGKFKFNLGPNVTAASLLPADPAQQVIKVSTALLPADQYSQLAPVTYDYPVAGTQYSQTAQNGGASLPLPMQVLFASGTTKTLDAITIKWRDPNSIPDPPY